MVRHRSHDEEVTRQVVDPVTATANVRPTTTPWGRDPSLQRALLEQAMGTARVTVDCSDIYKLQVSGNGPSFSSLQRIFAHPPASLRQARCRVNSLQFLGFTISIFCALMAILVHQ